MKLTLDPRTKMFILVLINIIVFTSTDYVTEWVCMACIAVLLLLMGAYRQCLRGIITYSIMIAALQLCAVLPGFLSAIISMMIICFRKILPIAFFGSGLIATTKVSDLICGLQKMRIPKCIVIPFAVTLRFFPTAKEEFSYIKEAMRLRGIGLNAKNILTKPLAVMEYILIPMMLRCAGIAEELSAAAVTRGIEGKDRRTSINILALNIRDAASFATFAALAIVALTGGGGIFNG